MIRDEVFKELSLKYGTPTYVFDANEVIERASAIKSILNAGGNKVKLCYSIKANPFLIPILSDVVDMFEVCSPGELSICIENNVRADMIIYSGVHKEEKDITSAIKYGVAVLTAESVRHYELICEASRKLNRKVDVILRYTSKSQFGMDMSDIETIIGSSVDNALVNIVGLHYFAGTQRTKLKHQREELEMLQGMFKDLRDRFHLPLEWFEYGPGLAYPYFEGDDWEDTMRPLKELAGDLYATAKWSTLTVEMGRFLASSCGYYMTSVADVKTSEGHNWCILDGGINHVNYLGQMMGLKVPIIKTFAALDSDENTKCTLCGSLCTTNDVLVREYKMNPSIGDVLVFCNIGAYSVTEGIYLFLSRTMPKILLVKDDEVSVIRNFVETWKNNC